MSTVSTLALPGKPSGALAASGSPLQSLPCLTCPYQKAFSALRELFAGPAVAPAPAPAGITLRAAIEEMLAAKRVAGLRKISIAALRRLLGQFAKGREDVSLASLTVTDLERWLETLKHKPSTRQSNIGRLSSLFSYHVRRGNLTENPVRKLERVRVEYIAPTVLTPEQAEKLLSVTPPRLRAHVIIGLFAGIRPGELKALTWKAVCLETKTVRVDFAKTRRRRIVPLEPCAVALLSALPDKAGNITPPTGTVRRFKRRASRVLGFAQWPSDLLRHTAASYLLALHGDAGKVSARLGNSSAILLTHYHQPVKKADCDRFWQIATLPRYKPAKPSHQYDRAAVRAFYEDCRSYKKTMEHFGIGSAGTLHYLLRTPKASPDTPAVTRQAEPLREAA